MPTEQEILLVIGTSAREQHLSTQNLVKMFYDRIRRPRKTFLQNSGPNGAAAPPIRRSPVRSR